MNEEELDLDSDSSDEDYNPAGVSKDLSEDESGSASDDAHDSDNERNGGPRKRKRMGKGQTRKKLKCAKPEVDEEKEQEKENSKVMTEDEKKKKSDRLWTDFLSGSTPPSKKVQPIKSDSNEVTSSEKKPATESEKKAKQEPQKITEILEFAGEKVKIEKTVTAGTSIKTKGKGGGGLTSILSQLGKKGKLSTLEKSKLDWDKFKSDEGLNEQLQTHNKGKNGYLERQDFLQRTDLRQFEIEKSMRASRRPLNR